MDLDSSNKGESAEGPILVTRNPATLEINEKIPEAGPEDVKQAVDTAATAQRAWASRSVEERLEVFERFRDLLLERKMSIARTVSEEVGKPVGEAVAFEIGGALGGLKFIIERGSELLEEPIPLGNLTSVGDSKVLRGSIGVVGVITPWNYPFGLPAIECLPPLFAGNGVVLKPSEATPRSAFEFRNMLFEAGLPEDLLSVVPGRGSVTGQALTEADIDHLSFTGSAAVGSELREVCSARGISICLECGGSDPAIVLPDADIGFTAAGIVWARFSNAGQSCGAVKRLYAHDSIEPELREEIIEQVENIRVGYDAEETVELGPLISGDAVEALHTQVEQSVEMGADVLIGGEPIDREGYFYEPTVLTNVSHDMPIVTEETFGPVLPIVTYETLDEAVEKANDTRYGLSASIWTRDTERGEKLAKRIEAGTVTVNDHLYTAGLHATPWGGYKDTGGNFSHGRWGIESVTRMKHIHVTRGETSLRHARFKDLWWFPYDEDTPDLMGQVMELIHSSSLGTKLSNVPSVLRAILGCLVERKRATVSDE